MITLPSSFKTNVLDSNIKTEVSWLFEVDSNADESADYYWSTKAKSWAGNTYTFKVLNFSPIQMSRGQAESGIQAPSEIDITLTNKDNSLTPSDFSAGAQVLIRLVVKAELEAHDESGGDGDDADADSTSNQGEVEIRTWRFQIIGVETGYQRLRLHCRDWLQSYLEGDYPNTPLVHYLFPTSEVEPSNACVPLIFGSPCIPLKLIYQRLILNGDMETTKQWSAYDTPVSHGRTTVQKHDGDRSWRFAGRRYHGIKSNTFTTTTGIVYSLRLFVYTTSITAIRINMRKGDGSGWNVNADIANAVHVHGGFTVNAWNEITVSWTEAAGGAGAYIALLSNATTTDPTYYIDDVQCGWSSYLLGVSTPTYTLTLIRAPKDANSEQNSWSSGSFTFRQTTLIGADTNNYKVAEFIAADFDSDGTADTNLSFRKGDKWLDAPVQYSRDDTVSDTNFADVIDYILQDWGISSSYIDATTLAAVKAKHTQWGLTCNVGFWFQEKRRDILARLLTMSHIELIVRDKIYFKIHEKTSQHTVEKEWVLKEDDRGAGSFRYDLVSLTDTKDSGYVAWQEVTYPLDNLLKTFITVKGSANNIATDVVRADYINNGSHARKIGILALQRKFLPLATISMKCKGKCLQVECDDVITIAPADYGGSYDVLIDSMAISKDLSVEIEATKFSQALDNWEDPASFGIQIIRNDTLGSYSVVITGPDQTTDAGDNIGNTLRGRLRVGATGNYILLDPVEPLMSFVEGGTTRLKVGDLGTFDYGIEIIDSAGVTIFKVDGSGSNLLCGGLELDGTNKRIESDNYISGAMGAGFRLDPDILEVGNIACRGIFRVAVFQADTISAVGGSVAVLPADVLSTDMTALDASTLIIEGNETFAVGDFLRIKDGTSDEWLEVTNIGSAPTYTVTRDKAGAYGADANPAWTKGASVVNYGASGDGGVYMTSSETNAPYLSVFTHAGAPWTTITTKARLGNLNGYAGYSADTYGLAIYEDADNYLKFDPTNGIRISTHAADAITVKAATAGTGIKLEAGADIEFGLSNTDPALIKWGAIHNLGGATTTTRGLCIWPTTGNQEYFYVGYDPVTPAYTYYRQISLYANSTLQLRVAGNGLSLNATQCEVVQYICAYGGVHVGGAADPGVDNLLVDGYAAIGGTTTHNRLTLIGASGDTALRFEDTDETDPAGRFAILSDSDQLQIYRSTAENWASWALRFYFDEGGNAFADDVDASGGWGTFCPQIGIDEKTETILQDVLCQVNKPKKPYEGLKGTQEEKDKYCRWPLPIAMGNSRILERIVNYFKSEGIDLDNYMEAT